MSFCSCCGVERPHFYDSIGPVNPGQGEPFVLICTVPYHTTSTERKSGVCGLGQVFKVSQLCLGGLECTVVPKLGPIITCPFILL